LRANQGIANFSFFCRILVCSVVDHREVEIIVGNNLALALQLMMGDHFPVYSYGTFSMGKLHGKEYG